MRFYHWIFNPKNETPSTLELQAYRLIGLLTVLIYPLSPKIFFPDEVIYDPMIMRWGFAGLVTLSTGFTFFSKRWADLTFLVTALFGFIASVHLLYLVYMNSLVPPMATIHITTLFAVSMMVRVRRFLPIYLVTMVASTVVVCVLIKEPLRDPIAYCILVVFAALVCFVTQWFRLLDTEKLRESERRLQFYSRTDALTGIANRRSFEETLGQALARSQRFGHKLGLLFIDLNGFKSVNDRMGHAFGDLLLKKFAIRLKQVVREVDFVARLGGDEFVVLVEQMTSRQHLAEVVQKIQDRLDQGPFEFNEVQVDLTGSVGASLYPDDCAGEADVEALIRVADQNMYANKGKGRQVVILEVDQDSPSNPLAKNSKYAASSSHDM